MIPRYGSPVARPRAEQTTESAIESVALLDEPACKFLKRGTLPIRVFLHV
jgi:hypothetical protein